MKTAHEPRAGDIVVLSPNGEWRVLLEHLSEVHFGPSYYALWLQSVSEGDNDLFGPGRDHCYGKPASYSEDSRYLVLESWASVDRPDTSAIVFDLKTRRQSVLRHIGTGFIRDIRFDTGKDLMPTVRLNVDLYDSVTDWRNDTIIIKLDDISPWRDVEWLA